MTQKPLVERVREHTERGEWDRAEQAIRRAAKNTETPTDDAAITVAILMLAAEYRTWNRRDDVKPLLEWGVEWAASADPMSRGNLLRALGELQTDLGLFDLAVRTLNSAFETHRDALGENAEETVRDLVSLAALAKTVEKPDQASSLLDEAIERLERTFGLDSPELIGPLKARADVLLSSDLPHESRCQPAEACLRRALSLQEAVDANSIDAGWTRLDLADILHEHEQCDEALEMGRPAWEIGKRHMSEDPNLFEEATSWLTWWYEAHHQFNPLVETLRTALASWTALVGPGHPKVAQMMGALANALLLDDHEDEADALCARAMDIFLQRYGELPMPVELLPTSLDDLAGMRLPMASVLGVRAAIALRRGQPLAAQYLDRKGLWLLDMPSGELSGDTGVTLATARADLLRQLAHGAGTESAAEQYFRRAIREAEAAGASVLADALDDYADWLQACGREAEAEQTRKQAEAAWDAGEE